MGRVNEKFYRGVHKLIVHEKYDLEGLKAQKQRHKKMKISFR